MRQSDKHFIICLVAISILAVIFGVILDEQGGKKGRKHALSERGKRAEESAVGKFVSKLKNKVRGPKKLVHGKHYIVADYTLYINTDFKWDSLTIEPTPAPNLPGMAKKKLKDQGAFDHMVFTKESLIAGAKLYLEDNDSYYSAFRNFIPNSTAQMYGPCRLTFEDVYGNDTHKGLVRVSKGKQMNAVRLEED